jgi:hypothetical protein
MEIAEVRGERGHGRLGPAAVHETGDHDGDDLAEGELIYANAHRGKVRKAIRVPIALEMLEEELPRVASKGWAEMIRKVYEVDPMICPRCGGRMKVVAFLTEHAVVDRIIRHLELTFVAEKPPPAYVFEQPAMVAAEESGEYE